MNDVNIGFTKIFLSQITLLLIRKLLSPFSTNAQKSSDCFGSISQYCSATLQSTEKLVSHVDLHHLDVHSVLYSDVLVERLSRQEGHDRIYMAQ